MRPRSMYSEPSPSSREKARGLRMRAKPGRVMRHSTMATRNQVTAGLVRVRVRVRIRVRVRVTVTVTVRVTVRGLTLRLGG